MTNEVTISFLLSLIEPLFIFLITKWSQNLHGDISQNDTYVIIKFNCVLGWEIIYAEVHNDLEEGLLNILQSYETVRRSDETMR